MSLQRFLKLIILSGVPVLCGACTLLPWRSSSHSDRDRIRLLQFELRRQKAQLQDLRERNMVLESKARELQAGREEASIVTDVATLADVMQPKSTLASNSEEETRVPIPFDPSAALDAEIEPRVKIEKVADDSLTGEQRIYSQILASYRQRKTSALEKSLEMMLKTYPQSVHADNALYLAGQLAFESNDPVRALQYMKNVIEKYPYGNKAVSALYAKVMIEKILFHNESQTARELRMITQRYPGSPEAAQAQRELKLLTMNHESNAKSVSGAAQTGARADGSRGEM